MPGYTWPNGSTGHSISWGQHQINLAAKARAKAPLAPDGGANALKGISPFLSPTGGATALKGGGPGTPAATTPTPPPPDPAFEAFLAGRTSQRDSRLADYAVDKTKVQTDFGYKAAGYDASGAPTGLTFDENNPFSKAALMKRNYDHQQTGTVNGMAAQGQLYSGALNRAKRSNEFGYLQGNDALLKALVGALTGLSRRERDERTGFDTDVATARFNRAPTS